MHRQPQLARIPPRGSVRWGREVEHAAISVANHKKPIPKLRHAVVRCIEHRPAKSIARTLESVYLIDKALQQDHTLLLAAVTDSVHVLEDEYFWQRVFDNTHKCIERARSRIIQPARVPARPVPRLGERLARRAAYQQRSPPLLQPARP